MAAFLLILCILSFLSGFVTLAGATTIFQQIIGAISFINAAILLVGVAIVNSVNKLTAEVREIKTQGVKNSNC